MRKIFLPLLCLAMATAVTACKDEESPRGEQAARQGLEAAMRLVAVDRGDTLAMEQCLLEARAVASQYLIMDDTLAVAEFDRAFKLYLDENDPQLSREIFTLPPQ